MVEEDKAHQFLMGLNDEVYSSIRSQILALDPLPSLDKIFNMVSQEEAHKNVMVGRDVRNETAASFAVKHMTKAPAVGEKISCKHCGRVGHEESKCFEIIRYPPRWGARGRGRGRSRGRGGRFSYGEGRGETAHAVSSSNVTGIGNDQVAQTTVPGFTAEQVQRILSLIEIPKDGHKKLSGKGEWLFDTGASCHMTGKYEYMLGALIQS